MSYIQVYFPSRVESARPPLSYRILDTPSRQLQLLVLTFRADLAAGAGLAAGQALRLYRGLKEDAGKAALKGVPPGTGPTGTRILRATDNRTHQGELELRLPYLEELRTMFPLPVRAEGQRFAKRLPLDVVASNGQANELSFRVPLGRKLHEKDGKD